jgi:hypothetical protein
MESSANNLMRGGSLFASIPLVAVLADQLDVCRMGARQQSPPDIENTQGRTRRSASVATRGRVILRVEAPPRLPLPRMSGATNEVHVVSAAREHPSFGGCRCR